MGLYARWIDRWERRLASRDTNRVVRPFEWGLDWIGDAGSNGGPDRRMREFTRRWLAESQEFYTAPTPGDFRLEDGVLTFSSPLSSPYRENNLVHADFFSTAGDGGRAVLVLPQWNADASGHVGLCRLLNRFGLTALRLSMAYHDRRMPPELQRADYHVSSNIGRTLHASRQSVLDARACMDWLAARGYRHLGILGTSLGSCIAFITAVHDPRIRAGAFNHVSMYFGDVVWTGLSTQHVRRGIAEAISQDALRDYWAPISPASYLDRLAGRDLRSLLIWGRYDSTFLPVFSRQVIESFRRLQVPHEVVALPCAHYTTGRAPFSLIDGFSICRFLRKHL